MLAPAPSRSRLYWQQLRSKNARVLPARFQKAARRGGEDDLITYIVEWRVHNSDSLRIHQSKIFEDSINVAVLRLAEDVTIGAEVNRHALRREAPCQERAAGDGMFEPGVKLRRDIAIEEDFDRLLLLARELADLEAGGVGGRLPIHVSCALKCFVGANAIEVEAEPPIMRLHLAGDAVEQILEA